MPRRTKFTDFEPMQQELVALREENARLRERAYRATHTTPGTHSTACITWGDDGQGNLSDGGQVTPGACSCGAWPAWLTGERDEARAKAIRFDLDEAGITQREKEAVELVELRAEVSRLEGLILRCVDVDRGTTDMMVEARRIRGKK